MGQVRDAPAPGDKHDIDAKIVARPQKAWRNDGCSGCDTPQAVCINGRGQII